MKEIGDSAANAPAIIKTIIIKTMIKRTKRERKENEKRTKRITKSFYESWNMWKHGQE